MISEFIWLELVEQTKNSLRVSCSLPDPGLYSDEEMIVCGEIESDFNNDTATVKVSLFDNFKNLCVGDSYQRKNFVQTVIMILNMKYGVDIQSAYVVLSDCWGTYSGDLEAVDEVYRGID